MGRPLQARKVYGYSEEFKITAVNLSNLPGVQVQHVAADRGILVLGLGPCPPAPHEVLPDSRHD